MAQLNNSETADDRRYQTPTFDPRSAFAWTLRGGEMARAGLLSRQPDPSAGENDETRSMKSANGEERRFETPTFDPRSAFARTLRGGEMARQRRSHSGQGPDALAYV